MTKKSPYKVSEMVQLRRSKTKHLRKNRKQQKQ